MGGGEAEGLGAGVWPTGVGAGLGVGSAGQSEPGVFFNVTVTFAAPDMIVVAA